MKMAWAAMAIVTAIGGVAAGTQAVAGQAAATDLATSRVFALDQVTPRKGANGGQSWDILRGVLATGEAVSVHESVQPVGAQPPALHAIQHSELIMVSEGTVAFEHDGRSETVSAGGVIYVAFGTIHRVKNVGDRPARYLVIGVGGDTKK
jgi:quercetin dioxygenase-like cupin family protein